MQKFKGLLAGGGGGGLMVHHGPITLAFRATCFHVLAGAWADCSWWARARSGNLWIPLAVCPKHLSIGYMIFFGAKVSRFRHQTMTAR